MSLSNDAGMVMPVGPMGGGYGDGMNGGGWFFWLLVIWIVAAMGNGFGFGGFGGGTGTMVNNDVQRGFDQQAIMNAIGGVAAGVNAIPGVVANGFAQAEIAANGRQMAEFQQHTDLAAQFANCCCENRLAVANLGAQIAADGAATRANTDAKVQQVMDKLCQLELDGIRQNYENRISGMQNQIDDLRTQVSNQAFNASQIAQTSDIVRTLNPPPIPAYSVQNPNGCSCGNRFGYSVA